VDYGRPEEATAALSVSEKFRVQSFLPVIDHFISSLEQRLKAYNNIYYLFGFLHKLESLGSDEIEAAAAKLVSVYKDDLDQTILY